MTRKANVVILCEGLKDYNFARRALMALGWKHRRFTPQYTSMAGGGAGESFVRNRYAQEVRQQRSRQGVVLLVMIDADNKTVAYRSDQLARSLRNAKLRPRDLHDKIAHWIPKRNLETWVHLYADRHTDEQTDYKNKISGDEHSAAAKSWGSDLRHQSTGNRHLPSLLRSLQETRRIR